MREYPRAAIATKADTDKRDSNVIESIVIGENKVGVVRRIGQRCVESRGAAAGQNARYAGVLERGRHRKADIGERRLPGNQRVFLRRRGRVRRDSLS